MRRLSAGPLAAAVLTLLSPAPASAQGGPVTWRLDNLSRIGGQAVEVVGSPRVVDTPHGAAVEFNGRTDGLLIARNPIQGLTRFTIEVLFEPDPDGAEEQRFLHIEQDGGAGRALIELRMNPDGGWALDTYLRTDARGLTLLDRARLHRPRWTTAALTYDGTTMAHYVDGVRELSGEFAFAPAAPGVTSLGVRRNLVSWFKGRIHTVRFTPDALTPERMLRAGGAATVIPLWPEGVPGGPGRTSETDAPTTLTMRPHGQSVRAAATPGWRWQRARGGSTTMPLHAGRTDARADAQPRAPRRVRCVPRRRTARCARAAAADFVALLYITLRAPHAHEGSRTNLLGADAPAVTAAALDSQVRADSPPVPLENSLLFFAALRKAGVPAEMHLYEKGPHGFGAGRGQGTASGWVTRCIEWMASHGWLEKN